MQKIGAGIGWMKMWKFLIILFFLFSSIQGAIRVSWVPVTHPDLAGYVVFRSIDDRFHFLQISSETVLVTDTFFLDEGAVGFRAFWYFVIAVDLPGNVLLQTDPECIVHYCHGDANLSGVVEVGDLVLLEQHVQGLIDLCEDLQLCKAADANLDGIVDVGDLVTVERFIQDLDAQEAHCVVAQ